MAQIVLDINDKELEAKLFKLAQKEHTDVNHIAFDALKAFVNASEEVMALTYTRLNPLDHISPIKFDVADDASEALPFSEISDPAEYTKTVRSQNLRS